MIYVLIDNFLFKLLIKLFTDEHILMSAIPAKLDDVVSYGDFSQEVPLQEVLAQDLLENPPDESLLHDILHGNSPINETEVHVVSSGKFMFSFDTYHTK